MFIRVGVGLGLTMTFSKAQTALVQRSPLCGLQLGAGRLHRGCRHAPSHVHDEVFRAVLQSETLAAKLCWVISKSPRKVDS